MARRQHQIEFGGIVTPPLNIRYVHLPSLVMESAGLGYRHGRAYPDGLDRFPVFRRVNRECRHGNLERDAAGDLHRPLNPCKCRSRFPAALPEAELMATDVLGRRWAGTSLARPC
jgi:hypothetical protein